MKIEGPTAGTIVLRRDKPAAPQWWIISFRDPVASRPIFLIQYASPGVPDSPVNPNSASSLTGLLIAVKDLHSSAASYESVARASTREILMPEFGAIAKEIVLERGSIFLLAATDPAGPTARRLKAGGEGILGATITVTDLARAGKWLGKRNISNNPQSILVSPEHAAGIWLQFQEQQK